MSKEKSLLEEFPDLARPGHYEDGSILRAYEFPNGSFQIEEWDFNERLWKIRPGMNIYHYFETWRADDDELAEFGIPEEDWNWPTSPPATESVDR